MSKATSQPLANRDEALKRLLVRSKSERNAWDSLQASGATDKEIADLMRAQIPKAGRSDSVLGICQIKQKPELAFWFGSYGVGEPTFGEDDLIAEVRELFEIPIGGGNGNQAKPEPEDASAAVAWDASAGLLGTSGDLIGRRVRVHVDFETESLLLLGPTGQTIASSVEEAHGLYPNVDWQKELERGLAMKPKEPDASEQTMGESLDVPARDDVDNWIDQDPPPAETEQVAGDGTGTRYPKGDMQVLSETGVHTIEESFLPEAQTEQLAFTFDFTGLGDDDAAAIKQRTVEIRDHVKNIGKRTVEIGDALRDVKRRLERGRWEKYLEQEFGMSVDTADRLIKIKTLAEQSPQFAENLGSFQKSTLYLLVQPSTPEEAREEIIERAASGEEIPRAKAQSIVDRHKPPAEEPIDPEVVITGRAVADLLVILKANAMQIEELVEMGFTPGVIDEAIQERLVDKTIKGKCSYVWTVDDVVKFVTEQGSVSRLQIERAGCQIGAILDAEQQGVIVKSSGVWTIPGGARKAGAEPREQRATTTAPVRTSAPPLASGVSGNAAPQSPIEDLLKGRALSVTFTWLPQMKNLVTVGVVVGADRTKMASTTLEASKVRGFPDGVHDLIVKQCAAKEGSSAVPAAKKSATTKPAKKPATKKAPAKKPFAGKTKRQIAATAKRQAKRSPESRKKSAVLAKKGGKR